MTNLYFSCTNMSSWEEEQSRLLKLWDEVSSDSDLEVGSESEDDIVQQFGFGYKQRCE